MANPYKKAEQTKKVAPGSRPIVETNKPEERKGEERDEVISPAIEEKPVEVITPVVEVKPEQPAEPVVELTVEEPKRENSIIELSNAFAGLMEDKKKSKSYSLYLDDDVVAALDKLAKQKKTNRSKVLNILLRNILLK